MIPNWAGLRRDTKQGELGLGEVYAWWNEFKSWFDTRMDTGGDIVLRTKSKGVIMTNAAGTITKRIRLNNAGDGIIIEDV